MIHVGIVQTPDDTTVFIETSLSRLEDEMIEECASKLECTFCDNESDIASNRLNVDISLDTLLELDAECDKMLEGTCIFSNLTLSDEMLRDLRKVVPGYKLDSQFPAPALLP